MAFSSRENNSGERVRGAPSGCYGSGVLPGVIRQIGYVVTDLDDAIASWLRLGVGPWFTIREMVQRVTYRGDPCEVTVSLALANSGDLQIELIQQHDDTTSIFTEFRDSGQSGYHQLAYWTTDFEDTMRGLGQTGWPVVWEGGSAGGARFAYLEPSDGPAAVIEIMELTDSTVWMAGQVRDAAAGWDGSDPVRELGIG